MDVEKQAWFAHAEMRDGELIFSVGGDESDEELQRFLAAASDPSGKECVSFYMLFTAPMLLENIIEFYSFGDGVLDEKARPMVDSFKSQLESMVATISQITYRA